MHLRVTVRVGKLVHHYSYMCGTFYSVCVCVCVVKEGSLGVSSSTHQS